MKKRASKRMLKMVTILCAAMFLFGTTTTVFAAVDLVGRGTAATTSTSSGSSSTSKTGSSTASSTTGSSASSSTSQSTGSKSQSTSSSPVVTNNATVSKVGSATVQTGVVEKIMPFMIGIGMALFALVIFFHLQMNQVRYGKSEKYYKELLDFLCACKL